MVSRGDAVTIGKGLLIGVVIDQIRGRARSLYVVVGIVAAAALVAAVLLNGAWRGVAVAVLAIAAAFAVVLWLVTKLAVGLLNRFAPARSMANEQAAIDEAIRDLDIPSGPIGAVRMGWRLRKGLDDEGDRIVGVFADLAERLSLPPDA